MSKNKHGDLPHLLISVDPGASNIKIVGSIALDVTCVPIAIDPYCLEVAHDTLAQASNFDRNSG